MVQNENTPLYKLEIPHISDINKKEILEFTKDPHSKKINYTDDLLSKEFVINYFKK
jgi:hypothetical protein